MITSLKLILPESLKRPIRPVVQYLRKLGCRNYCPVCASRVRKFEPLPKFYFEKFEETGYDYRHRQAETCNVSAYCCPRCGASDRDRLYALYLSERLPHGQGRADFRLLDIAPGVVLSAHIRRSYSISYRTADLVMQGVDDQIDVMDMAIYPDCSFDAFICSHVLEHVQDDIRAMAELYRVLKPGGWGITMVPIEVGLGDVYEDFTKVTEAERWKHFGQGDHVRMYSRAGFLARLRSVGFSVLSLETGHFQQGRFGRCGISASSVLYISEKPRQM